MRARISITLAVVLAACGDTLVDHRDLAIQETPGGAGPEACIAGQLFCDGQCRSVDVGPGPDNVCGGCGQTCLATSAPANAAAVCSTVEDPVGRCEFDCNAGFLETATGCAAPALVAAGGQFSCATAAGTGEVHCWGSNSHGQLGPGVTAQSRPRSAKVASALLANVRALAAGPAHACAAVGDPTTVYCWGDATGWSGNASSETPVAVPALAGVTVLAAGANHTCGIAAGTLRCTGAATVGGGPPALGGTVLEVSAGDSFTCALVDTSPRSVKCWGANDRGQSSGTGSGTGPNANPSTIPFPAGSLAGLVPTHVAAGAKHACASTNEDGNQRQSAFCWGDNTSLQIGPNASGTIAPATYTRINKRVSSSAATPLEAGGVASCAVVDDGGNILTCWSGDVLARGGGAQPAGEDIDVMSFPGALSVGGDHACIVDPSGKLACWGHGTSGQLGNGANADSSAPVLVVDR